MLQLHEDRSIEKFKRITFTLKNRTSLFLQIKHVLQARERHRKSTTLNLTLDIEYRLVRRRHSQLLHYFAWVNKPFLFGSLNCSFYFVTRSA